MPRVENNQSSSASGQPYGLTNNDNTKSLQERLMDLFAPQDFVRVRNIDDEAYHWQYMPAHAEDFEYTSDPMKITRRGQPELWFIEAGGEDTLVGANAYLMIDGLYKKIVAKEVLGKDISVPGQARNFNLTDADKQSRIIAEIFQGKVNPSFNTPAANAELSQPDVLRETVGVSGGSKK